MSSPLRRMEKSRDHWKDLAVDRATENREARKQVRRQRDRIAELENLLEKNKYATERLKKKMMK